MKQEAKDQDDVSSSPKKRKKRRKAGIVAGVVVAVIVVAGAGFWVWHEQPSFCGAICHDPMNPYLTTYEAEPADGAVDKYGNEVDGSTMLAAVHRVDGEATCLSCHEPTLSQQIDEGITWVTGDFESPLDERSLIELTEVSGKSYEQFCLNDACHELLTIDSLGEMTSYMDKNVHDVSDAPHSNKTYECGDCHKAHTQSVVICSQCHDDATVPDGWLTYDECRALSW